MVIGRHEDDPVLLDYQVRCPICNKLFEYEEEDKKDSNIIKCPHCKEDVDISKIVFRKRHYEF